MNSQTKPMNTNVVRTYFAKQCCMTGFLIPQCGQTLASELTRLLHSRQFDITIVIFPINDEHDYFTRNARPLQGDAHFPLSAFSISRRIASERDGSSSCFAAHLSIAVANFSGSRNDATGVLPVGAGPRLLCITGIDRFMETV